MDKAELKRAQQHLSRVDPVLKVLIKDYGDCTLAPKSSDYYAALVSSIVSQQLSVKAADNIWKRTLDLFKGRLPTPEQLRDTDPQKLRAAGMSNAKVIYVKDLATHILEGRLDLNHVSSLSNQAIIGELTTVKGIGEWTTHMFLIFSLGRLDVLAWGDLGVRSAIRKVYKLVDLPTPNQVAELAETHGWHPYESIACWYLWRSLDNKA